MKLVCRGLCSAVAAFGLLAMVGCESNEEAAGGGGGTAVKPANTPDPKDYGKVMGKQAEEQLQKQNEAGAAGAESGITAPAGGAAATPM